MARTKEFDPDAALRAAMDLFWRKGYEATSMQDLVDHLGIGRGSIYGTYGSKQGLFLRALDRYGAVLQARYGDLDPEAGLEGVRRLLWATAEEAISDGDRKGCMITNTVVERAADDPTSDRMVRSGLDGLEAGLTAALTAAAERGELAPEKDPRALARFLVTVIQGIRVLAHVPDPRRIQDAVREALSILE